jgi:CRISPR-associated protein Cmr4
MGNTPHLFRITCLTNMHVGSGETNYSVIDNEIERDPVLDNVPVINASSLKGALREHCELHLDDKDTITHIFGTPPGAAAEGNTSLPGQYKFFSANLLLRPLRDTSTESPAKNRSYVLATTKEILECYDVLAQELGYSDTALSTGGNGESYAVEGKLLPSIENADIQTLAGPDSGPIVLAKSMKAYPFPVLARNQLDKGISKNLWYEEIVPHTSRFYFFVLIPDDGEHYSSFKAAITGNVVQIGGNASIGEGYCRIEEVIEEVLADEQGQD